MVAVNSRRNRTHSRLLRLPRELRDQIWKLSIDGDPNDHVVEIEDIHWRWFSCHERAFENRLDLLKAYSEANGCSDWERFYESLSRERQALFFRIPGDPAFANALSLFFVSHQVRDEARTVFFSRCLFEVVHPVQLYSALPDPPQAHLLRYFNRSALPGGPEHPLSLIQGLQIKVGCPGYVLARWSALFDRFPNLNYVRVHSCCRWSTFFTHKGRQENVRIMESFGALSEPFEDFESVVEDHASVADVYTTHVCIEFCRRGQKLWKVWGKNKTLEQWVNDGIEHVRRYKQFDYED